MVCVRLVEDYGDVVMVKLETPRGISRFPVDRSNVLCKVERGRELIALQTLWATLPSTMLTGDKLRFVNSQMRPGPAVDVPRASIKAVLVGAGALAKLQAYAATRRQPRPQRS